MSKAKNPHRFPYIKVHKGVSRYFSRDVWWWFTINSGGNNKTIATSETYMSRGALYRAIATVNPLDFMEVRQS